MKELRTGEVRFTVKEIVNGKKSVYRVYDKARGSFPYVSPELGTVQQDFEKEASAVAEADRLNILVTKEKK